MLQSKLNHTIVCLFFAAPASAPVQVMSVRAAVERSSTGEGTKDSICEGFIGSPGDRSQGNIDDDFHGSSN